MKKMSMFALLLAAVLVTSYSVSGTYAKYTSTYTATDSARVALWDIRVNSDENKMASENFTFNLFDTVNDTDGNAETDVKKGEGETIIAPGTQGSFDIVLANKSEVNATYAIDYTVTNTASIPVKFSVDGTTWTDDLADVKANAETTKLDMTTGTKTIKVQWMWAYEGTDAKDTELGTAGSATLKVDAKVTATQID